MTTPIINAPSLADFKLSREALAYMGRMLIGGEVSEPISTNGHNAKISEILANPTHGFFEETVVLQPSTEGAQAK